MPCNHQHNCYIEDGFLTERDHNEEVVKSVRLSAIVAVVRNDHLGGDPYVVPPVRRPLISRTTVSYSNGGFNDYPIDATDLLGHLTACRNNK